MPKVTKKLTETQFRMLLNAQMAFEQARAQFTDAQTKLKTISSLILDAHGLSTDEPFALNVDKREIETEIDVVPIEALAPDD